MKHFDEWTQEVAKLLDRELTGEDLALLSEWHTQHMTPRQAVFQFKNYRGVMG